MLWDIVSSHINELRLVTIVPVYVVTHSRRTLTTKAGPGKALSSNQQSYVSSHYQT